MIDIFQAVANNDFKTITSFLDNGIDINKINNKNCTPLMYAKSKLMVEFLISKGANINIIIMSNIYGVKETILTYMFVNSTVETVEALIDNGAQIYLEDKYQIIKSLIIKEIFEEKYIPMYELLYRKGVNFSMVDNCGDNVLHYLVTKFGCNKNILEMISFFINHGVNINQLNNNNEPPIYHILRKSFLIESSYYCLQNFFCRTELFKFLIDNGADILNNFTGNTFLHYLISRNMDKNIVKYIKILFEKLKQILSDEEFKLYINHKDNFLGLTPLQKIINHNYIFEELNDINFEIVKILVENGADINMKFDKAPDMPHLFHKYIRNEIILHRAVDLANVKIVKYFLDCKINIHEKNIHGFSSLDIAIINSSCKQKFKNRINKLLNNTQNNLSLLYYLNDKIYPKIQTQINNSNNNKVASLVLETWSEEYKTHILEFYNLLTFIKLSKNIKYKNMITYILYNHYIKELIAEKNNIIEVINTL